jgi:hypothetical protein
MIDIHLQQKRIRTVGATVVELASGVSLRNVDLGEVAHSSDLHVFGCLDKMDTLKSTVGHGACTTARLGAVSNRVALDITNRGTASWGSQSK